MVLRVLFAVMVFSPCLAQQTKSPPVQQSPSSAAERAETVVQQLYKQIVTRQPIGIPQGADRTAIWPFLSKGLIRRLELAQSCERDYRRQHAGDDAS